MLRLIKEGSSFRHVSAVQGVLQNAKQSGQVLLHLNDNQAKPELKENAEC